MNPLLRPAPKPRGVALSSGKAVAIVVYMLFLALPFVQMVLISFQSTIDRPGMEPGEFTLINYANILLRPDLRASIGNSVLYVIINIGLTIPVALPAAYAFSRYRFLGDQHLFLAFIAFRITPPVVLSMPLFQLFAALDLINAAAGIALAHCLFNIPITVWILQSFIDGVPRELDETAFLDGYSLPAFFIRILIPMILPGIGVAAFFCFMFSWVEVVFARILTVTAGKPISMAINALFSFTTDYGLVMAMTLFSMVPGLIMIYFVRHHLARGFTIGSGR